MREVLNVLQEDYLFDETLIKRDVDTVKRSKPSLMKNFDLFLAAMRFEAHRFYLEPLLYSILNVKQ